MTDLWSFLLQTLTASGVAVLLLAVKALFADKLSPRWQFGVWGLLAVTLLLPAGLGGRYVLFQWPLLLETVKTLLTGSYAITRVAAPIPLFFGLAPGWPGLLFGLYLAGGLLLLLHYLSSYLRLRLVLRRGTPPSARNAARLEAVRSAHGLKPCRAVEVEGLSSAFVCGFFSPVLALPAQRETDEKVLLHELLHRSYGDVGWGLLLCLFRCIHWCNPLLWYCFNRIQNDCEALCDQRALERLEGEDRRDYGRILLSMADEQYARAPGTSSMANGGSNIKRRIASIARFKRYPAGMALASACVAVILALPILLGGRAAGVVLGSTAWTDTRGLTTAMASARTTRCTTAAGALDTYGKAVLTENGIYRALCAPVEDHPALAAELHAAAAGPEHWMYTHWESGLPGYPDVSLGYCIYNLTADGQQAFQALMVFPLLWGHRPDGTQINSADLLTAVQPVRAEKGQDGWVVLPLEDFALVTLAHSSDLHYGGDALPAAITYRGEGEEFSVEATYQTIHSVDNTVVTQSDMSWFFGGSTSFETSPKPGAVFGLVRQYSAVRCVFTGSEEIRSGLDMVGLSVAPLPDDGARPALQHPGTGDAAGSCSDGSDWCSRVVTADWDGTLSTVGGGGQDPEDFTLPAGYAMDLYLNGQLAEQLTLLPQEGGEA